MDDDIVCESCGFRFTVIWARDALSSSYPVQINNCPRCGDERLIYPEETDDA